MDALDGAQQRKVLLTVDLRKIRQVLSVANDEAEHLGKWPQIAPAIEVTLMLVEDELGRRDQ